MGFTGAQLDRKSLPVVIMHCCSELSWIYQGLVFTEGS